MTEVLRIVLPVIWAVVAALIGWFLYRRSTAKAETRWLWLGGAAVIAILFFFAMYWATPKSFTECVVPGAFIVQESDIMRLRDLSHDVQERIAAAREACTKNPRRDDRCVEALDALEVQEVRMTDGMQHLHAARPPDDEAHEP